MNRARIAAAIAALLTALLLQATVVGPAALPVPVSLPALLVAAIALIDGPGTGLAFGFAAGLVADLASDHPAGVLALCWLVLGLVCGRAAPPPDTRYRSRRADALVAAVAVSVTTYASLLLLVLLGEDGATLASLVRYAVPTALLDALLSLGVVALVRVFLTSETLRAPRPVLLLGEHS